ncbi:MAG: hypothetical protein ACI9FR_003116, partial [Cryomorphaceae bacterium]
HFGTNLAHQHLYCAGATTLNTLIPYNLSLL